VSVDEAIEIVDYDPRWPGRFRGERDRVRLGLPTFNLRYEHIGGTAVPGLAGKPVVDLMLGAPPAAWAALPDLRARIVTLGYEDLGEAGVPGRIAFRKRTLRAFNIALVELDGALWRDNLVLRDHLRAHPDEAAAYAAAKRAAFEGGARTLLAYSEREAPVIAGLLARAHAAAGT
jgi:GrpB-like predicted nucleotidyltransferase (UPF0157 family)